MRSRIMPYSIKPCQKIRGVINLPGDKSISHRAIMISSIACGDTLIKNFSFSDDCRETLKAFKSLGVDIQEIGEGKLLIRGVGLFGLKKPERTINLGESGTTARMLIGLLSAQKFNSRLNGKVSLRNRPMLRVIEPLRLMGAKIKAKIIGKDEYLPVTINPSGLKAIKWKMKIPSAQVKSAIFLAGLYTAGKTEIREPIKSRDHTERMLKYFKAGINSEGDRIYINPVRELVSPGQIFIPADISSASFFIVLACLVKGSYLKIRNVCLNPSRLGLIDVLTKMGAKIKIIYKNKKYFEPMGDLIVRKSKLSGITIKAEAVPVLIDELPILMVAASLAKGRSIFQGLGELRVKETDRIRSMVENLSIMGVKIKTELKAGKEVIIIDGRENLNGSSLLKSFGDHRTAMSMVIAALCADSPSKIDNIKCISKSFPNFLGILKQLIIQQ